MSTRTAPAGTQTVTPFAKRRRLASPDPWSAENLRCGSSPAPKDDCQCTPRHFHFMGLPPELRCLVYRTALARYTPIDLRLHDDAHSPSVTASSNSDTETSTGAGSVTTMSQMVEQEHLNIALLCVSKTIYREARPILYGENTFMMPVKEASQALKLLLPSRILVKHLRLEFTDRDDLGQIFPRVTRLHLRYFRGLKDLTLVIPSHVYDDAVYHHISRKSHAELVRSASMFVSGAFVRAVDWLPTGTKVALVGTDFGGGLFFGHVEGKRDATIEKVVQGMVEASYRSR